MALKTGPSLTQKWLQFERATKMCTYILKGTKSQGLIRCKLYQLESITKGYVYGKGGDLGPSFFRGA